MKKFLYFTTCCLSLFGFIQAEDFPVQEVMKMTEKDAILRKNWVRNRDFGPIRAQENENTARLKEIFAHHKLPVGEEAEEIAECIQQLVLHSSDLAFQKEFLEMASSAGDIWSDDLSFLIDRTLLRQGLPQRYGTHLRHEAGLLVPYPIKDFQKMEEERKKVEEPPFADYLDIMRAIDRAIAQNNDSDLYKIFFNLINDFNQNPDNYLYYASFEPNQPPRKGEHFLAFEDPALAASYALCQASSIYGSMLYQKATEDSGQRLFVSIIPHSAEDAVLCAQTPIYIYLIPRGDFQPEANLPFSDRLLSSLLGAEPVVEIQCNSAIEALLLSGSKLEISGFNNMNFEYEDEIVRNQLHSLFFFDMTLENENFDPM